MSFMGNIRRWIKGDEPALVDFESYPQGQADAPPTPAQTYPEAGAYKMQQSYDSLLTTVRELREALDGQTRRQEEVVGRLGALPAVVEALPQTSKMQSDMLALINDRLKTHAQQQRKVSDMAAAAGKAGNKEISEALLALREQIEAGNEIDRQLVDSFNRFSLMIDRLQLTNHHAAECLQQVRDSYAAAALQMQEWVDKSRQRNGWLVGGAFIMSLGAVVAVIILLYVLFSGNPAGTAGSGPGGAEKSTPTSLSQNK